MTTILDLDRSERRLFHAYWNDGLLELLAGLCVAGIGVGWSLGAFVPMLALPAAGIALWHALRRRVVEPRFGSVVFTPGRQRRLWHALVALLSLGLVVGGSFLLRQLGDGAGQDLTRWLAPAIPSVIMAAMALSASVALGLWRFTAFAAVFLLCGLGAATLALAPWWALMAGGAFMAAWGAVMLWRFIQRHPGTGDEDMA